MALSAYLTLVGQKQGPINGSVTEKGRENSILVHSYENSITSPRDAGSGLGIGKHVHQPITVTKEMDRSSVLLWNALVNNENLTTWVLKIWTPTQGLDKQIYTVTLTDANIAGIREYMAENLTPMNATLPIVQEITFTYQKIQWNWIDGNLTGTDHW